MKWLRLLEHFLRNLTLLKLSEVQGLSCMSGQSQSLASLDPPLIGLHISLSLSLITNDLLYLSNSSSQSYVIQPKTGHYPISPRSHFSRLLFMLCRIFPRYQARRLASPASSHLHSKMMADERQYSSRLAFASLDVLLKELNVTLSVTNLK